MKSLKETKILIKTVKKFPQVMSSGPLAMAEFKSRFRRTKPKLQPETKIKLQHSHVQLTVKNETVQANKTPVITLEH